MLFKPQKPMNKLFAYGFLYNRNIPACVSTKAGGPLRALAIHVQKQKFSL